MNTAIVMLGTNINCEENLSKAKSRLSDFFEIIDESVAIYTKPIGKKYTSDFLNQAIKLLSDDKWRQTEKLFKEIENELGRSSFTNQKGIVPIDIDLIFWNGVQKRADYDKFSFVKQCVDEIKENTEITT